MLFADVDRSRVRKCAQCVLHFYDTSKKGTRRSLSSPNGDNSTVQQSG
jgi:predicted RNA-binding Zn ribbon-like protein